MPTINCPECNHYPCSSLGVCPRCGFNTLNHTKEWEHKKAIEERERLAEESARLLKERKIQERTHHRLNNCVYHGGELTSQKECETCKRRTAYYKEKAKEDAGRYLRYEQLWNSFEHAV